MTENVPSFPGKYPFLRCRSESRSRDRGKAINIIMKRLILVALAMGTFALGLTSLVEESGSNKLRVRPGTQIFCYHPVTPGCVAL
jgi:hypothetical protein